MPMAGIFLLLTFGGWLNMLPVEAKSYVYLVTGFTTLLMPVALMPVLKKRKLISSYYFVEREERRIPLLLVAFFYLAGAFILQKAKAPAVIPVFLNGCSMVVLACALINWKWKISTHMAAIGGVTGMVLAISMRWLLDLQVIIGILFLLAGLIGFARLRLSQHTPAQVYSGYLVGIIITFLLIRLI